MSAGKSINKWMDFLGSEDVPYGVTMMDTYHDTFIKSHKMNGT